MKLYYYISLLCSRSRTLSIVFVCNNNDGKLKVLYLQIKKDPPMPKWKAFFQPFNNTVWLLYMVTLGICFIIAILHALTVFNHDFAKNDPLAMLQFTYQLFLDNSSPRLGDIYNANLRIYFAVLLFASFTITASYKVP